MYTVGSLKWVKIYRWRILHSLHHLNLKENNYLVTKDHQRGRKNTKQPLEWYDECEQPLKPTGKGHLPDISRKYEH